MPRATLRHFWKIVKDNFPDFINFVQLVTSYVTLPIIAGESLTVEVLDLRAGKKSVMDRLEDARVMAAPEESASDDDDTMSLD